MSDRIKEKIRKIKLSRLDYDEKWFVDLINSSNIKSSFLFNKDYYQTETNKNLLTVNKKNKSVCVSSLIVDYYDGQGFIKAHKYVADLIHKHLGFNDYQIVFL